MAELKELPEVKSNPLYYDTELFEMYMTALDEVVANPEIRISLDEFRLSPHALRMLMIRRARQVLVSAPREFAAYEAALGVLAGTSGSPVEASLRLLGVMVPIPDDDANLIMRRLSRGLGAVGLMILVAGVSVTSVWPWTQPLVWAGASLTVAGAVPYSLLRLAGRAGLDPVGSQRSRASTPDLARTRDELMAAVSDDEFLARARTFINNGRQGQMGQTCNVVSTAGLSETYDSTYQVPTSVADELEDLLARLDGASIGVAGPRGSGKSTLVRSYCDNPASSFSVARARRLGILERYRYLGDLQCMVTAPVEYAPRDFVLHLFAVFCREVIGRYAARQPGASQAGVPALAAVLWSMRPSPAQIIRVIAWGVCVVALLRWQHPGEDVLSIHGSWAFYTAVGILLIPCIRLATLPGRVARYDRARARLDTSFVLAAAARRHLARVRYLQTHTSGWSGTLGFPAGGVGQYSRGSELAEQPLSYPEIVSEFRRFARDVATDLHGRGGRIYVGIDELDKIGAPDQAERFLNEIKGIFGIPHLYFIVSVSDDALTAFERRGLPLRDAFDSSFDEIVHVGPLTYSESRRLLNRRVIGLPEPYVALCHCLAGGLARDLIRAARQVIRVQQGLDSSNARPADRDYFDSSTAYLMRRQAPARQPPTLTAVCAAVVRDELRRKARAIAHVANDIAPGQAQDLHTAVHSVIPSLTSSAQAMRIVDIVSQSVPDEPATVTSLRLDLAAFAYYCATLQDVFNNNLSTSQMITATSTPTDPGSIDAIAAARHAFTLDTQLAWQSITQFRKAWHMETRDPPATPQ
jgi:hypothetical protein